jgi:hypothetical protein
MEINDITESEPNQCPRCNNEVDCFRVLDNYGFDLGMWIKYYPCHDVVPSEEHNVLTERK